MSGAGRTMRLGPLVEAVLAWLAVFVVVCLVVGTAYLFLGPDPGASDAAGNRTCASCARHPDDRHDHGAHGMPAT